MISIFSDCQNGMSPFIIMENIPVILASDYRGFKELAVGASHICMRDLLRKGEGGEKWGELGEKIGVLHS